MGALRTSGADPINNGDEDTDDEDDVGEDYQHKEFVPIEDDDEQGETPTVPAIIPPHGCTSPPASESGPRSKISRSTIPTWLADEYADARTRLDTEIAKAGRPLCYQNGQFMMTAAPLVFARPTPHQIEPIDFYRPRFFVWLPHLFHRIPCPACNAARRRTASGQPVMLRILSWPKRPRRVVDIEHLVFIIGHRYYCGHGDCKKTYQSWSPAILNSIPAPLASQFSFHLTHRCGLSDRMVAILRASFQRGIGPHPFAEIVRRMHLRFYELRHLEYLETVRQRAQSTAAGLLARHLPFPRWGDPSGYGGYTPSHRYFRGFYDAMIERHAGDIDQHMAMLSAELLSHDHSFKVCNSIVKSCRVLIRDLLQVTAILGKVDGVRTFGALHTACNNYGECRKMTLTPTKGHEDCMPALAEIPATLVKYGHSPVKVVFTDNVRGDKEALERAFPSLLDGVNPVPSSSLEDLEIPSDWDVCRLGSVFQVNGRMNSIMEDLSNGDLDSSGSGSRSELHVAMDMEWPVDRDTGIYGKVALISIAYGRTVFLIPVSLQHHIRRKGLSYE